MMRKVGHEWVVFDSTGRRVLGRHKTKREALAQLRAIEASQHRRANGNGRQGEGQ